MKKAAAPLILLFCVPICLGLAVVSTTSNSIPTNQVTQMASAAATTDSNGVAQIDIKVPGFVSFGANFFNGYTDPVNPNGRYIDYGECAFDSAEAGDKVIDLEIIDEDGVIPTANRALFPNWPSIGSYIDTAAATANQGWFMWTSIPTQLSAAGLPRYVPGGLWVRAKFQKQTATSGKTIYCNFKWSVYSMAN